MVRVKDHVVHAGVNCVCNVCGSAESCGSLLILLLNVNAGFPKYHCNLYSVPIFLNFDTNGTPYVSCTRVPSVPWSGSTADVTPLPKRACHFSSKWQENWRKFQVRKELLMRSALCVDLMQIFRSLVEACTKSAKHTELL